MSKDVIDIEMTNRESLRFTPLVNCFFLCF